jgi:hypothetical protein
MAYFLLVFDRAAGRVLEQVEFADSDEAVRARFRREADGVPPEVEVVVLGAENIEALHATHGRYFGQATQGLADVGAL